MRGFTSFLLVLTLGTPTLQAQVTITHTDLQAALAPGKIFTQINLAYTAAAPLNVQLGQASTTAQTWDFSSVGATGVDRYTSVNYTTSAGASTPDHALFPQSNVVLNVMPRPEYAQATRFFFRLDSAAMVQRGWISRSMRAGDSARAVYRIGPDGLLTLPLPVRLGGVASYRDSTYQAEGTGEMAGNDETSVRAGTVRVDAFGTATFPDGRMTAVLRLVRDQTVYTYRPGQQRQSRRDVSIIFVSEEFEQLVFTTFSGKPRTNGQILIETANYTAPGYVVLGPDRPGVPTPLALGQAWPNPASTHATIPFSLEAAAPIRLTAFDALGRQVAVLADGARSAGAHAEAVDVSAWPPGLYLLELRAGRERRTRMLTVLR